MKSLKHKSIHHDPASFGGWILVEMLIALMLLISITVMLPTMVGAVYRQRATERFERLAQLELSNLAVRLQVATAESAAAAEPALSDCFQQRYPTAVLQADVGVADGSESGLSRWKLSISKKAAETHFRLAQSLTIWTAATEEPAE